MTFESIARTIPGWIVGEGPESGIVISSRTRLARNLSGVFYVHRADDDTLAEVVMSILDAALTAGFSEKNFFYINNLSDLQKSVFIERHLISPALASNVGNRGVLVRDTEISSVMVNEEDHLRIQSMRHGFDLMGSFVEAVEIEDRLSHDLTFSSSDEYGYLTACPTNMGTGLRASVLIHLPALVLTKEIERVIRSSGQLGMAVRGYRGEGSDVIGNLFQISNQKSFGKSDTDIVRDLVKVVKQIIDYEKKAADMLMNEARYQIEDKIFRSIGILKSARILSTHEFMNLASAVRLGLHLGLLKKPGVMTLNELLILTQPGHIQEILGKRLEPLERDRLRAERVRERFIDVGA